MTPGTSHLARPLSPRSRGARTRASDPRATRPERRARPGFPALRSVPRARLHPPSLPESRSSHDRGTRPSRASNPVRCARAWRARGAGARVGDGAETRASPCRNRAAAARGSRRRGARPHGRQTPRPTPRYAARRPPSRSSCAGHPRACRASGDSPAGWSCRAWPGRASVGRRRRRSRSRRGGRRCGARRPGRDRRCRRRTRARRWCRAGRRRG